MTIEQKLMEAKSKREEWEIALDAIDEAMKLVRTQEAIDEGHFALGWLQAMPGDSERRAQQPPEEEDEENDEEEFELKSVDGRKYVSDKLRAKYPDEVVKLIYRGELDFPLWLRKEILERRQRIKDLDEIKVYCTECGWKGTRKECGFGHDDVICSTCGTETIKEEVMPYQKEG